MKNFIKIILITILTSFLFTNLSYSETPHYIDFSRVLNQSKAGKEAQELLKKKFETESKKFSEEEKKLRKEETDIISKKKLITKEELDLSYNRMTGEIPFSIGRCKKLKRLSLERNYLKIFTN